MGSTHWVPGVFTKKTEWVQGSFWEFDMFMLLSCSTLYLKPKHVLHLLNPLSLFIVCVRKWTNFQEKNIKGSMNGSQILICT